MTQLADIGVKQGQNPMKFDMENNFGTASSFVPLLFAYDKRFINYSCNMDML